MNYGQNKDEALGYEGESRIAFCPSAASPQSAWCLPKALKGLQYRGLYEVTC